MFEFVFTSLVKNSPRLFTTVQTVMKAYETSKLYRDLKLRGSIVKDGDLVLLPREQVFDKISGVWNLSSEQGNLGAFFITNIRIVWHCSLASNFNVSLPYLQIKMVRIRDSKFGKALVLETFAKSGGYILGFRVDPADTLSNIHKQILSFHQLFSSNPDFGVDFTFEDEMLSTKQLLQPKIEEDIEIINEQEDSHAMAAYYAEGADEEGFTNEVVYDESIGLAVESLKDGLSLDQLWRII